MSDRQYDIRITPEQMLAMPDDEGDISAGRPSPRRLVDREPCDQLIDAVAEMRHQQKDYFRTRSSQALAAAKRAETRVDKLLDEIRSSSLFD